MHSWIQDALNSPPPFHHSQPPSQSLVSWTHHCSQQEIAPSNHTGFCGPLAKPQICPPPGLQPSGSLHEEGTPLSCRTQHYSPALREPSLSARLGHGPLQNHCASPPRNSSKSARVFLWWLHVSKLLSHACPTLWDPMVYTVREILPARILEWIAVPFTRGSSQPRDRTQISHIVGRFFTSWATREAQEYWNG